MTHATQSDMLTFSYRPVVNGQAKELFKKKAHLQEDGLVLKDGTIPITAFGETFARGNRLVVVVQPDALPAKVARYVQDGMLVFELYGTTSETVKRGVDRAVSIVQLKTRYNELKAAGAADKLRVVQCPSCTAALDLTDFDQTRYVHCRFCDAVFEDNGRLPLAPNYKTCDECGMFDRTDEYTEFYFYFLLVVYGFRSQKRFLCDGCAHDVFKKMLVRNLIFVLGLPATFYLKYKSLTRRDPALRKLATANRYALKADMDSAEPIYQELRASYPDHPGLLFNEAIGWLTAGENNKASDSIDRTLAACSNYRPVHNLLINLQQAAAAHTNA